MKNNKCLGIDGFPAKFLKVFWGKLKFFVLRCLNHAYRCGEMSISITTYIISCLPKGDKPRMFLKNCRLISLLSVVYKIASSAIASRLKTVHDQIISRCQQASFKVSLLVKTPVLCTTSCTTLKKELTWSSHASGFPESF